MPWAPERTRGRSPRVRGRHPAGARDLAENRPIPACAGETFKGQTAPWVGEADPRVCGGDLVEIDGQMALVGRSPRVRGRPMTQSRPFRGTRPIPACAGETWRPLRLAAREKADPRVCGGDTPTNRSLAFCNGRSPRVRGRRSVHNARGSNVGPIPACAGETVSGHIAPLGTTADPRVCGGDSKPSIRILSGWGRSPRVRGRRLRRHAIEHPERPIPACAGETGIPAKAFGKPRADPRVCGGDCRR